MFYTFFECNLTNRPLVSSPLVFEYLIAMVNLFYYTVTFHFQIDIFIHILLLPDKKQTISQSSLHNIFSGIWTKYGNLQSKFSYSVLKRENKNKKN